eukprot:jgi/Chlat1/8107/Chrsp75S07568
MADPEFSRVGSALGRLALGEDEEEAYYAGGSAEGEEDDSGEEETLQTQALDVGGEPDFSAGPPADGAEYLRRVRWEAAQCPKIVTAKNINPRQYDAKRTSYVPSVSSVPDASSAPDYARPRPDWEAAFLKDFAELRAALAHVEMPTTSHLPDLRIPPTTDARAWDALCFRSVQSNSEHQAEDATSGSLSVNYEDRSDGGPVPPLLGLLLRLDEATTAAMLRRHVWNLENTHAVLTPHRASWLFALCARLDMPIDASTAAALRSLLRHCATLRADQGVPRDMLPHLNILIAVAGKYFAQDEYAHNSLPTPA